MRKYYRFELHTRTAEKAAENIIRVDVKWILIRNGLLIREQGLNGT
jgi:hypothetical protein